MDLCSLLQVLTLDPFAPRPRLTFLPRGRPCSFAMTRSRKLHLEREMCHFFLKFIQMWFQLGHAWLLHLDCRPVSGLRLLLAPQHRLSWPPSPACVPARPRWRSPPRPSSSSHAISPLGSSCLLSLHTDWHWGHSLSPPQTGLGDQPFLSRFPEHTPGWAWGPFFSSPVLCPASRTLQVAGPLRSVPVCADRCALVSDVTL